ncbi:RsmE family RNA methyltransferase [Salinispira pacifica]
MKRFLLSAEYGGGERTELSGSDFHYLCRVRRMRPGDGCDAVDRAGRFYRLTVESVGQDRCTVRLEPAREDLRQARASGPLPGPETGFPDITLFQCLPKGSKLDLIVRQATETGVSRIVPLLSEHTAASAESAAATGRRVDRWRRIAREALQQSGARRLPEISAPVPFAELERSWAGGEGAVGLFFHERPVELKPLEQRTLHEYLSADPKRIAIVIGPEGGLSNSEIERLLQSGFEPVYLGPQVLRTETAALYAIAAVQIVLLEKEKWRIERD